MTVSRSRRVDRRDGGVMAVPLGDETGNALLLERIKKEGNVMLKRKLSVVLGGLVALSSAAIAQPALPKGDSDAAAFRDGFLAGKRA
jgi:hypothetical protein